MNSVKTLMFFLIFMLIIIDCQSQKKNDKPLTNSTEISSSSAFKKERTPSDVEPDRKFSYAERELDYLMHIWEGEFDNVEQLDVDKIQGKSQHRRIHVSMRPFQNSNFGESAIYYEEYRDDNPNIITRQCIYQLIPNNETKAISIKTFHFKEKEPLLSKQLSFDKVTKLAPNADNLIPGCDMLLVREGDGFVASTVLETCGIQDTNRSVGYQFFISSDKFNFIDANSGNNFDDITANKHLLEKARCFTCMIDFPNTDNGRPTITKHYIDIYDQGGKFDFKYTDGRQMFLGMRNTWSFGMHRETFVIYIIEKSTQKTLIYSWGNPGADRIGFNPGWIRVQCDIKTPRNVKLQLELRPGS